MIVTIQLRRDTSSNWTLDNPVLAAGEVGLETDTQKAKVGNGVATWNTLGYWNTGAATVSSVFGRSGAVTAQTGDYTAAQVGAIASSLLGTANGVATLDGTTHVPTAQIPQLSQYNPTGLTGATSSTSYAGGTVTGHPLTGTWTQGQWVMAQDGRLWACVAGGTPGTWRRVERDPDMFAPEDYGAKRDGALLYDVAITNAGTALTTVGLPAPATPTLGTSASGGTILAGTYGVIVTYVNQYGETLGSTAASIATTGSTSTITVTKPPVWTNATGYYVYMTQAGGVTYTRQQAVGQPRSLAHNYVLTTPPTNTGATPPVSNTTASAPFTAADVGKNIVVPSAGGFLNVPLTAKISAFVSSQHVTLDTAASSTVSSYGAVYGTDDTAAIQNCINAATLYGEQNQSGSARVLLSAGMYCVAGAPGRVKDATGATLYDFSTGGDDIGGNAQIYLPFVDPAVGHKVDLRILSPYLASAPLMWVQPNPVATGAVFAGMRYADGTYDATYGPTSVMGGSTKNSAGAGGVYSNMRLTVDGLNIMVPYRATYAGLDCYDIAQCDIVSYSYFGMAISSGGGGWPPYVAGSGNPSPWGTFAYRSPASGNNDRTTVGRLTSYGPWYGVVYGDHFNADTIECLFGYAAVTAAGGAAGGNHHCTIKSLSSEGCSRAIQAIAAGTQVAGTNSQGLTVQSLHVENADFVIEDPNNVMFGEVFWETLGLGAGPGATPVMVAAKSGGRNIKLWLDYQPLGISASPAPAASGTALVNQYWQNAQVHVSGGTVTDVTVDNLSYGVPTTPIPWPNGSGLKITYSVTPTLTVQLG